MKVQVTQDTVTIFSTSGRRVGMVPRSSLKEGKNSQMVEKETKTTQQQNHQPQPKGQVSTILWSFLCAEVKQVKRRPLTIDGPEFSDEELGSEGSCSSKVSKKSSSGLHITINRDQRPLHGVWQKHGHNAGPEH